MHVGYSVLFTNPGRKKSDAAMYASELGLVDEVESRGFDSVWTAEHHFSDYILSPNPLQFLSWVAGRTNRVKLGTMVVVVPWHDPVRLAEQILLLDQLSGGRAILGFGRGLGQVEFNGFRLAMGESRTRFMEYSQAIAQGLETGKMEHNGELYKQPPVELRPMPTVTFKGRTYASVVSPESVKIMARLGFGLLIIAQKPWKTIVEEVENYRNLYIQINGEPPPRPLLVNFSMVHESTQAAVELKNEYGYAYSRASMAHYDFTNEYLSTVNGYEYYANLREKIVKHGKEAFEHFLADLQIIGTPTEVTENMIERIRTIDGAGFINIFSYGGMPESVARKSLDLFTSEVLPTLRKTDQFRDVGAFVEAV